MAKDASGSWIGYGLGDSDDPKLPRTAPNWHAVTLINQKLHDKYQWARDRGAQYGPNYTTVTAHLIEQFCLRAGLPVVRDAHGDAVASLAIRKRLGSYPPPPVILPVGISIEGHCSNMAIGPAADTCDQLEAEGLMRSQWVGYANCNIPFTTQTGVDEAARLLRLDILPGTGTALGAIPFPAGTPWILATFSEGSIAGYELYAQHLAPGCDLEWREQDRIGTLAYGNPCRATDSIAPWAMSWITKHGTHGLDPLKRFGLPGCPAIPPNFMDVYREGDIFAENDDSQAGQMRAAVYQAVARGKVFGGEFSLLREIAQMFGQPISSAIAVFEAIISGAMFLADNPNPHYSPYDLTGGLNWARGLCQAAIARAA